MSENLQLVVTKVSKEQAMIPTGWIEYGSIPGSVQMKVEVMAICTSDEQYAQWEKVLGKTLTVTER